MSAAPPGKPATGPSGGTPIARDSGRFSAVLGGALGFAAALPPLVAAWGFTVDDALVTARVAHHLGSGHGYRFNLEGPPVDAVTPLGWAHLLAPFAAEGVLPAWRAARGIGAVSWLMAATWLGWAIGVRGERSLRFLPLVALATSMPIAAWAGSGMETGLVTALATLALGRHRLALVAAGLAAGLRPELIPWALTLAVGTAWADGDLAPPAPRPGRVATALLAAIAPTVAVACVRAVWFGTPTPLAVVAKPSDLAHGSFYAAAAGLWTGVAALLLAPWALARAPRRVRVISLAIAAHAVSLALAGGDWMPAFRLAVPVVPGAILVAAELVACASAASTLLRTAAAAALGLWLFLDRGDDIRRVAERRLALVRDATPLLAGAERVAALDVGWVGASGAFAVVDLAGITDPTIAALPGGHTSKRVPHDLVAARDVDRVVLLLAPGASIGEPWAATTFARQVEARVAGDAAERGFTLAGTLALGGTDQVYVVARRSPP